MSGAGEAKARSVRRHALALADAQSVHTKEFTQRGK
jgi:hypothetical protein